MNIQENDNFVIDQICNPLELSELQKKQNQELVDVLSKYWKVAKVEPLRDNKNAHITCLLLKDNVAVAQMDFNAPIDRLHDLFSWNHENLRKFIQEFI